MCYFFDGIMRVEDFDIDKISLDQKIIWKFIWKYLDL